MPVWVLTRERGPGWDHARGLREQEAWDEQAAFMEALADEGFILLGGPIGEDRVMHVIVADSEQEVYAPARGRPVGADGAPSQRVRRALARPAR